MIVCGNLGKAYSSYSDWTLHDGPSCRSNVEKPSNEEKKINWRKQEPSAHATLATLSLSPWQRNCFTSKDLPRGSLQRQTYWLKTSKRERKRRKRGEWKPREWKRWDEMRREGSLQHRPSYQQNVFDVFFLIFPLFFWSVIMWNKK